MSKAKDDKKVLEEQLKLIRERLIEEGGHIPEESLVVEYDNGGGQRGIRENPFYPAYEKLLMSYTKTLAAYKTISSDDGVEFEGLEQFKTKLKMVK